MGPLQLLLLAAALGLVGYAAYGWRQKLHRRWRTVAKNLGGAFRRDGPWYNRQSRIDATLDDQPVTLDSTTDGNVTFLRARAPCELAGDLELSISRKYVFSRWSIALGAQDVLTGHEAFDDAFVVKASDEDRARAWLTPELRAALLPFDHIQLHLRQGEVVLLWPDINLNGVRMEALAALAAAFTRRGEELRRFWNDLATRRDGALEPTKEGRLRIQVEEASIPLRIETAYPGGTMIAARRLDPRPEPYVVDRLDDLPPALAVRMKEPLRARIEALGAVRIEADEHEVRLVAPDLAGDADRLEEAIAIAETLAKAPQDEAYR